MASRAGDELREKELRILKGRIYGDLCQMIGHPVSRTTAGPDGREYNIEIQAFWDDKPGGDLRVVVSIDDGGWRAMLPRSDSFVISSDNQVSD